MRPFLSWLTLFCLTLTVTIPTPARAFLFGLPGGTSSDEDAGGWRYVAQSQSVQISSNGLFLELSCTEGPEPGTKGFALFTMFEPRTVTNRYASRSYDILAALNIPGANGKTEGIYSVVRLLTGSERQELLSPELYEQTRNEVIAVGGIRASSVKKMHAALSVDWSSDLFSRVSFSVNVIKLPSDENIARQSIDLPENGIKFAFEALFSACWPELGSLRQDAVTEPPAEPEEQTSHQSEQIGDWRVVRTPERVFLQVPVDHPEHPMTLGFDCVPTNSTLPMVHMDIDIPTVPSDAVPIRDINTFLFSADGVKAAERFLQFSREGYVGLNQGDNTHGSKLNILTLIRDAQGPVSIDMHFGLVGSFHGEWILSAEGNGPAVDRFTSLCGFPSAPTRIELPKCTCENRGEMVTDYPLDREDCDISEPIGKLCIKLD